MACRHVWVRLVFAMVVCVLLARSQASLIGADDSRAPPPTGLLARLASWLWPTEGGLGVERRAFPISAKSFTMVVEGAMNFDAEGRVASVEPTVTHLQSSEGGIQVSLSAEDFRKGPAFHTTVYTPGAGVFALSTQSVLCEMKERAVENQIPRGYLWLTPSLWEYAGMGHLEDGYEAFEYKQEFDTALHPGVLARSATLYLTFAPGKDSPTHYIVTTRGAADPEIVILRARISHFDTNEPAIPKTIRGVYDHACLNDPQRSDMGITGPYQVKLTGTAPNKHQVTIRMGAAVSADGGRRIRVSARAVRPADGQTVVSEDKIVFTDTYGAIDYGKSFWHDDILCRPLNRNTNHPIQRWLAGSGAAFHLEDSLHLLSEYPFLTKTETGELLYGVDETSLQSIKHLGTDPFMPTPAVVTNTYHIVRPSRHFLFDLNKTLLGARVAVAEHHPSEEASVPPYFELKVEKFSRTAPPDTAFKPSKRWNCVGEDEGREL